MCPTLCCYEMDNDQHKTGPQHTELPVLLPDSFRNVLVFDSSHKFGQDPLLKNATNIVKRRQNIS